MPCPEWSWKFDALYDEFVCRDGGAAVAVSLKQPPPRGTGRSFALNHLTELAEKLGLISTDAITIIFTLPQKSLIQIVDLTTKALFRDASEMGAPTLADEVTLVASSSFRSDSGCRCWDCRSGKLEVLARYTALYADRLIIPVYLGPLHAGPEAARIAIADLYFKHALLRPLFDENLAAFGVDRRCLCRACDREFENLCDIHDAAAFDAYLAKERGVRVIYRPPRGHESWYTELQGPQDLIPHGNLHLVPIEGYRRKPAWAPKILTKIDGAPGAFMPADSIRKNRIGGRIFAELARDAIFQQYYGIRYNGEYVTDSAIEADFLYSIYRRDDLGRGVLKLLALMKQQLPLLAELPIRRVLSIRRNERDVFVVYRNAISGVVRQYLKPGAQLTEVEAKEIFSDVILPQLLKLKVEAAARKRSAQRRSLAKVIAPFSAFLSIEEAAFLFVMPAWVISSLNPKTRFSFIAAFQISRSFGVRIASSTASPRRTSKRSVSSSSSSRIVRGSVLRAIPPNAIHSSPASSRCRSRPKHASTWDARA